MKLAPIAALALAAASAHAAAQSCTAEPPITPSVPDFNGGNRSCKDIPYSAIDGTRQWCVSKSIAIEDVSALTLGLALERDERGNILRVVSATQVVAQFGAYDVRGRPGWYDDGATRVTLTWNPPGLDPSCFPVEISAHGWTTSLRWEPASQQPAQITTPVLSRFSQVSALAYYPDGNLAAWMYTIALPPSRALVGIASYSAAGEVLASRHNMVAYVSTPPGSSAATLEPRATTMQPKVGVVRPPIAGGFGPAAVEVFGPVSTLYPLGDWLARMIARWTQSALHAQDEALRETCEARYQGDLAQCARLLDEKYGPSLPPERLRVVEAHRCERSAYVRWRACMTGAAGEPLALPYPVPPEQHTRQQCLNAAHGEYIRRAHVCDDAFAATAEWAACMDSARLAYEAARSQCEALK